MDCVFEIESGESFTLSAAREFLAQHEMPGRTPKSIQDKVRTFAIWFFCAVDPCCYFDELRIKSLHVGASPGIGLVVTVEPIERGTTPRLDNQVLKTKTLPGGCPSLVRSLAVERVGSVSK